LSEQLIEQLTLALFDTIAVEPTRDVLLRGADAISGGVFLFAHHHVPARPATITEDWVWLAMLDLVEDARRYNQAGRAVLDLTAKAGAGSNGPIGTGDLMFDRQGLRELAAVDPVRNANVLEGEARKSGRVGAWRIDETALVPG
jgi:hypothetical protein